MGSYYTLNESSLVWAHYKVQALSIDGRTDRLINVSKEWDILINVSIYGTESME